MVDGMNAKAVKPASLGEQGGRYAGALRDTSEYPGEMEECPSGLRNRS